MTADDGNDNVLPIACDPVFRKLGRKKAYEEVTDEIRRQIFSRRMPAAHRLPTERDLAVQFGVSRMAVREAIRGLERTGLVTVKKGARGGIFVAQDFDRPINESIINLLAGGGASLSNLFEIRALIEPYAAARAAETADPGAVADLADLVARSDVDCAHDTALRSHNLEFHRLVLRMSGNPVMSVMGEAILTILSDRIKDVVSPDTSVRALGMHKLILEAIRKRQPAKAKTLMEQDIRVTGDRLAELGPEALTRLAAEPSPDAP